MAELSSRTSIVLLGGGKMGEAILAGWIGVSEGEIALLSAKNFTVIDPGNDRRTYLEKEYGVTCLADLSAVPVADIVVLAVKPQVMIEVLEGIIGLAAFADSLFISIAAGMTTDRLVDSLPDTSRLVRVMPNMPLQVCAGASAVCASATSHENDVETVLALFDCLGVASRVEEDQMDAVCGLSGSGPAYVAAMIEALVKASVEQGLSKELAEQFAIQTVYGTAVLLRESDFNPSGLREAVSSPGGTTLAALEAMNDAGMEEIYRKAVEAAVRRSKELSKY